MYRWQEDIFLLIKSMLECKDVLFELILQCLVHVIDAELFEGVCGESFEAEDV